MFIKKNWIYCQSYVIQQHANLLFYVSSPYEDGANFIQYPDN